uniref:N-acetyltransferase domain-containing protein n=1 Tax=viral metagenome TaxID=1070528 RepID=A0A6C0KGZ3_9ZZZZ
MEYIFTFVCSIDTKLLKKIKNIDTKVLISKDKDVYYFKNINQVKKYIYEKNIVFIEREDKKNIGYFGYKICDNTCSIGPIHVKNKYKSNVNKYFNLFIDDIINEYNIRYIILYLSPLMINEILFFQTLGFKYNTEYQNGQCITMIKDLFFV